MLVFDGGRMPAKTPTDEARARKRHAAYTRMQHENKETGDKALRATAKLDSDALKARISELRKASIQCVVALSHADSQLVA